MALVRCGFDALVHQRTRSRPAGAAAAAGVAAGLADWCTLGTVFARGGAGLRVLDIVHLIGGGRGRIA